METRFLPSPFFNARPQDACIDLIVVHAMSLPAGHFSMRHVEDLFLGCLDIDAETSFQELQGLEVSSHFVVDRNGDITQFVPVAQRAWHAGASSWCGREQCNDYSIGIELLGDENIPFTDAQYHSLAALVSQLMRTFPAIAADRIVGHQDVAPGRKWDPGKQWNWSRFFRLLDDMRSSSCSSISFA